jgi:myo-inositol 2-dehydrogenase / D-chiro-inositol 1-dehydrogenase
MGASVHGDKTQAEDKMLCILEFANGAVVLVEDSGAKRGGMDDRNEVCGEAALTSANLLMGNGLVTRSDMGLPWKRPDTRGCRFPVFGELEITASRRDSTF